MLDTRAQCFSTAWPCVVCVGRLLRPVPAPGWRRRPPQALPDTPGTDVVDQPDFGLGRIKEKVLDSAMRRDKRVMGIGVVGRFFRPSLQSHVFSKDVKQQLDEMDDYRYVARKCTVQVWVWCDLHWTSFFLFFFLSKIGLRDIACLLLSAVLFSLFTVYSLDITFWGKWARNAPTPPPLIFFNIFYPNPKKATSLDFCFCSSCCSCWWCGFLVFGGFSA